jgi:hypothetical protein
MGGTSSRLGLRRQCLGRAFQTRAFLRVRACVSFSSVQPAGRFHPGIASPCKRAVNREGPWLRDNFHKGRHNHVNRVRLPGFAPICDPFQPMTLSTPPADPILPWDLPLSGFWTLARGPTAAAVSLVVAGPLTPIASSRPRPFVGLIQLRSGVQAMPPRAEYWSSLQRIERSTPCRIQRRWAK